jgi:DNA repair exonuclease SbcCD ATPase subunit
VSAVDLAGEVAHARNRIEQETGEARAIIETRNRMQARAEELAAEAEVHQQVVEILTRIGEARQESTQRQIEDLVTRGLQVIFSEELTFHLVQGVRGGQAQVDFVVRSTYPDPQEEAEDRVVETPVMDARGGGLAAAIGFMLRLVVLMLTPSARRFLALDETFAHVSAEFEPRLAEFLREVSDKAGVQILMVTHSDAFTDVADARYRLALGPDGATIARRT